MEEVTASLSPHYIVFRSNMCCLCFSLPSCSTSEQTCIHIICAYFLSSDHSISEFSNYVNDFVSVISSHEPFGPLIVMGYLNAYFNAPTNQQGDLLFDAISNSNLFIIPVLQKAQGTPLPLVTRKQLYTRQPLCN